MFLFLYLIFSIIIAVIVFHILSKYGNEHHPHIILHEMASSKMTDSQKLEFLANWFDSEQQNGRWNSDSTEVQNDLRRIAAKLRNQ